MDMGKDGYPPKMGGSEVNEKKQTRRRCSTDAPRCPYVSEDVNSIPCRALTIAFGVCFALMALWEVISSWM